MNPNYDDIVSRIAEPPMWFDENAVPRYREFTPEQSASIHVAEIALVEITCQECGRPFLVALSLVNFTTTTVADAIRTRTLHYGDPPAHRGHRSAFGACHAGDSMNSEPRRVLEYWHRKDPRYVEGRRITDSVAFFRWMRDHSLEVDIQPDWLRDHRQ